MLPVMICTIENTEDRDLMSSFYLQYRDYMYREARKYLANSEDAEDIVHDALVRIIDKIEVFRTLQPQQQLVYAKVTIRNLAYILQKRRAHFDVVSFDDMARDMPVDEQSMPEDIVELWLMREKVNSIWRETDIEDRLLLEQKYILKWTDQQLAEQLGIQPQSVRMRLTRTKRSIVRQMEEKGFMVSQW